MGRVAAGKACNHSLRLKIYEVFKIKIIDMKENTFYNSLNKKLMYPIK